MRNLRTSIITLGYFLPLMTLAVFAEESPSVGITQASSSTTSKKELAESTGHTEMDKSSQALLAEKSNENEYKERSVSSCKVCEKY